CYHGSEVPQLTEPSKKPSPQAVFSFTGQEITRRTKGSQEDPFKGQNSLAPNHFNVPFDDAINLMVTTFEKAINALLFQETDFRKKSQFTEKQCKALFRPIMYVKI
ncbi:hypothetical protein, partial [Acinetobacter baumannii]|uniref:hypothetical protein n=1 Tax=Acinetobacter baumannii TaxID=470 RepID=UPI001BC8846C